MAEAKKIPEAIGKASPTVYQQIDAHIQEILKLFHQPKLTLIIRSRALEEEVIITNETDPTEIINAVKKHALTSLRRVN